MTQRPPLSQLEDWLSVDLPVLKHVRDLVYFEGPLTSLFLAEDGGTYIYHWYDCDDTYNRWLVFEVSPQELESLPESVAEVLKSRSQVFVADLDDDGKTQRSWLVPTASLEHMPL